MTIADLVELFGIGRATVYRALNRHPVEIDTTVARPPVDA